MTRQRPGDRIRKAGNDDLAIEISVAADRQAAESLQLEAIRLLQRHGLRVKAASVTRASETTAGAVRASRRGSASVSARQKSIPGSRSKSAP